MIILVLLAILVIGVIVFMRQPMFGKTPSGARLQKIQQSPHYKNGKFQNIHPTPDLTEGVGYLDVLKEFVFGKRTRSKPANALPTRKTDLLALEPGEEILVWFGHSSYFLQVGGKKILVDPVLSGAASPIKATTRSFTGTDIYVPADLPFIDYLFISHDHWDHLDYKTIQSLRSRINKVICGLGVGQHLQHWGFDHDRIFEQDWGDELVLDAGFTVNITPARHFSGRGFKRNQALWISFVLKTPGLKLFLGGDGGYDTHFAEIGDDFGPFDLAILECGQYDKSWKYIHMMPEEIVQAAIDLKARQLMPVHWGKFLLANHEWDTPIVQVSAFSKTRQVPLVTPMIGEKVNLNQLAGFTEWWAGLK